MTNKHNEKKRTVNHYLLDLSKELLNICLTRNTADGNLYTGGIGSWGFLQMKMSENLSSSSLSSSSSSASPSSTKDEISYLHSALDATREALYYCENKDQLIPATSSKATTTTTTTQQDSRINISLFTDDWIGAKCLLAAILHKIGKYYETNNNKSVDPSNFINEAWEHANDVIQHIEKLAIDNVDNYAGSSSSNSALFGGLAGALQAIWFLRQELQTKPQFASMLVLNLTRSILIQGFACAQQQQQQQQQQHAVQSTTNNNNSGSSILLLKWNWKGEINWGTSHGVIGILHSLLGLTNEEWIKLESPPYALPRAKDVVQHTIDNLEQNCPMLQNAISNSSGNKNNRDNTKNNVTQDVLLGWSNGLSGYCLLLLKAAEVYDDVRYVQRVKVLAENIIWPCRDQYVKSNSNKNNKNQPTSISLATGLAGNAYVFLALHRLDGNNYKYWILCAKEFTRLAVANWEDALLRSRSTPSSSKSIPTGSGRKCHPFSLYTGLGGLVSLLLDLERPEVAHFPLYETKAKRRGFNIQLEQVNDEDQNQLEQDVVVDSARPANEGVDFKEPSFERSFDDVV